MLSAAFVGSAATLACLLEASAEKPGNVTPSHSFHDTSYEDFLRSAAAVGPELALAGTRPVGATVLACVQATRRWTRANTNLGIALLLAPLARAALADPGDLRGAVGRVLAELTVDDARAAYAAIRLAAPGGLGSAAEHDVADEPTATLLQAMASAAGHDTIAAEYASGYRVTFERGLPALREALERGATSGDATVHTFLVLLAEVPDTLIARKLGAAAAADVSTAARECLVAGSVWNAVGRGAIAAFDTKLRDERNRRNPGTTADLVAATLFVALLTEIL